MLILCACWIIVYVDLKEYWLHNGYYYYYVFYKLMNKNNAFLYSFIFLWRKIIGNMWKDLKTCWERMCLRSWGQTKACEWLDCQWVSEICGMHIWFHICLMHHYQCDMGLLAILTSWNCIYQEKYWPNLNYNMITLVCMLWECINPLVL